MKKLMLTAVVAAGLSAHTAAQDPAKERLAEQIAALKRETEVVAQARASVGVESRVTAGAPYSAEAITELTQVLADGNRISKKTVSRIYRDGEGRTRREEIDAESGALRSAVISDPVAHLSYSLDPATRTAFKTQVYVATPSGMSGGGGGRGGGGGGGAFGPEPPVAGGGARGRGGAGGAVMPAQAGEVTAKMLEERKAAEAKAAAEGNVVRVAPVAPVMVPTMRGGGPGDSGQTTREELGNQTIEGVVANGSRSTTVIPAGAIGNLQPIKIVSESWMSNDLKVLVLTRHSDPRSGETTYKLQGIVRAEPDRALFSPPPDYTVKERQIRMPVMKQP